jgi:hypothetical protein
MSPRKVCAPLRAPRLPQWVRLASLEWLMLFRVIGYVALSSAAVVVSAASCSVFVIDTAQAQCESAADCVALGIGDACVDQVCVGGGTGAGGTGGGGTGGSEPVDPKWGCLGEIEWPAPVNPMTTLRFGFRSAIDSTAPANIAARFCAALDVECLNPLVSDIPIVDGVVEFEVESGTIGYLEVTSTVDPPTIRPALIYSSRPAGGSDVPQELPIPVILVTPGEYDAIVQSTEFVTNEERGTLLTITTDCTGQPSAGVRIDSTKKDAESTPFYFVGLLPDPDATQTDIGGFGGIFNMPLGAGTVDAFVAADDRWIGRTSFHIRAGWLTNVPIEPTPGQ